MNVNKSIPSQRIRPPAAGWQLLGKLDLPVDSDPEDALEVQLEELVAPLKLEKYFLSRVLRSCQEATGRVVAFMDVPLNESRHVRIDVFVPQNTEVNGKPWGFFRIERLEGHNEALQLPAHTFELYLYTEE